LTERSGGSGTLFYRRKPVLLAIAMLFLAAIVCGWVLVSRKAPTNAGDLSSAQPKHPGFVGATTCAGCHSVENAAWQNSKHAKAMQHATAAAVLGDFADVRFKYGDIVSTFFMRNGKFFVSTDGPDGKLADFEILYTFGIYPLQQYLVAFPDGRLQALPIAWDARPREQGGAHWYHLYPNDHVTFKDTLHWTRLNQNWNWMCADCHTTKLERHYDSATNTYATTWEEMNVACEACHGPGSNHVAWARKVPGYLGLPEQGLVVALDERRAVTWTPVASSGNAVRSVPLSSSREITACAQCHSRRTSYGAGMDHEGGFFDTHDVALLSERLYFPDGQQRDEVYEFGSFLQSKMHAHGVTCSDCHDPHSGQLRVAGNGVCAQCHAAAKYATTTHTLHETGSTGAQCAACHMPARNYMVIDTRRDHSIRVPRPDLSGKLNTPNACTTCHQNRSDSWAANIIERAFGPDRKGFQTFGAVLHDASTGAPGAAAGLSSLMGDKGTPAIVRATAIADLEPYLSPEAMPALEQALSDPDFMVRDAASDVLLTLPAQERVRLALGLIDDSSLIVRAKAARALAILPDQGIPPGMRAPIDKAFAEYIASQQSNSERPEAHVNLGLFYSERRDPVRSETEYRAALALDPDFIPAYVNLADLYRDYHREADAEVLLTDGLQKHQDNADLQFALGLLRVRQTRIRDALELLGAAARDDPANPRYAFVYGIALHDSGQAKQGVTVLQQALRRFPQNQGIREALAEYARGAGVAK
jgi:tetratricopeptide (TPR) repeat protein/bacterioferritin-associated ferredoxin